MNHYNYKILTKCKCELCKKCRSSIVRNPKTDEELALSKKYKFIRILYCELSYVLREREDELKDIYIKITKDGHWNDKWPEMTIEDIYYDLKTPCN